MEREQSCDILKGLLILFVVIAHYDAGIIHDIIFLFHMPLFFILSGYVLKPEKIKNYVYIKKRTNRLLVPYVVYLLIDMVIRNNFSLKIIVAMFWGGRSLSGTYWYITCLVATLFLFCTLIKHFADRTVKCLIFVGGGVAVVESHLSEDIQLLSRPGIPWSLDTAFIAVIYVAIGFYHKESIKKIIEDENRKIDIGIIVACVFLNVFCIMNYWNGRRLYYFDMKPIYYKELFLAIIIPCSFGLIMGRIIYWLTKIKVLGFVRHAFALLGRMTLPIMFMHIPANICKDNIGYGRTVYVLIGMGVPVLFTVVFYRYNIMRKLFGLPDLSLMQKPPAERLSQDEKNEKIASR